MRFTDRGGASFSRSGALLVFTMLQVTEGWLEIDKHYSLELCFSITRDSDGLTKFKDGGNIIHRKNPTYPTPYRTPLHLSRCSKLIALIRAKQLLETWLRFSQRKTFTFLECGELCSDLIFMLFWGTSWSKKWLYS